MSLDDAIRAAEEAAQRLREALDVLEREAAAALGPVPTPAILALKQEVDGISLAGVRAAVAEKRRPKGPCVTLEYTGKGQKPVRAEVIRRTATQVVVLRPDWGALSVFKVADGTPVKGGHGHFLGYWRIREADLATIRAMPSGENAVSKALRAIEAGRYDEVKA